MVGIVYPRLQKSAAGDETLLGSALRILKAPRISVLGRRMKKNTTLPHSKGKHFLGKKEADGKPFNCFVTE